eukprot:sb/3478261/
MSSKTKGGGGASAKKNSIRFVPISPVREQVKRFTKPEPRTGSSSSTGSGTGPAFGGPRYNEVERLLDQKKVSRDLSEWFKNPAKANSFYVQKIIRERLRYDE